MSRYTNLTPGQRAVQTRRKNARERARLQAIEKGHQLVEKLQALPDDLSLANMRAVAQAVIDVAPSKDERVRIFSLLDGQPGLFQHYLDGHWYRLLRTMRNRYGPLLRWAMEGRLYTREAEDAERLAKAEAAHAAE